MSSSHCDGLMDFGGGVCSSTTSSVVDSVFGVGVQQQRGTKRHSEEAREDVKSICVLRLFAIQIHKVTVSSSAIKPKI